MAGRARSITVFMCGDVMTGRGIDQVLPHPSRPHLYEPYVKDARDYVLLAEEAHGPIEAPVSNEYPWGDALAELERASPDVRLINLETSITTSEDCWPGKGIHYRMHPGNIGCLTAAGVQVCALANNHVLDWGPAGLEETQAVLARAGIETAGAGGNLDEARRPAVLGGRSGRVLVCSFGTESSGVPPEWAATTERAGVDFLPDLSPRSARSIAGRLSSLRQPGDLLIASIHWGSNWGYRIPLEQRAFAHALIDEARVDLVHGHSSHHPRAIEVHRGKPILYGCGDFLNDYEGIRGYEDFRGELTLMYFASMDPAGGELVSLRMVPMRIRRLQVIRASPEEARWLRDRLDRECGRFGGRVSLEADGALALGWD